jgi:hypothetical protein
MIFSFGFSILEESAPKPGTNSRLGNWSNYLSTIAIIDDGFEIKLNA